MKTKSILIIALVALLPTAAFTQPNNPPNPPVPPVPPVPPERHEHERGPKVPVTFLGVETSPVPPVVCEQLGLAKGFGLVVDYVVPDSPAAAAGVQPCDIVKMLNDQILMEPAQLRKLLQSFPEGTTITLTVLRKGQEQKITVKLTKKEVPQRRFGRNGPDFGMGDFNLGDLGENFREQMNELKNRFGNGEKGMIHDAVMKAHDEVMRAKEEALREGEQAREEARRARDEARRAREEGQRARGQVKITRTDDAGLHTTKIDMNKAQIVFSDDKGELRIDSADGKKILTAKDPQGRLLFSGPVENKEDLDKIPAEVRARFEKLQQKDLPSVVSTDENDEDDDSADMDDGDDAAPPVEQVSMQSFTRYGWMFRLL